MLVKETTISENKEPFFLQMGEDQQTQSRAKGDPPPDTDDDEEEDEPKASNPRPWPNPKSYLSAKRVFALLIAIDHYDTPGANLGGCVKDSLAVEKYLRESTSEADQRLHIMQLRSPLDSQKDKMEVKAPAAASIASASPDRNNIIGAFQGFLGQAGEDDVVFVHYSGHGSFETRPKELWHLDAEESSTHRAESLVCKDSYTKKEGTYVPALRDKELRWLLAKVAERKPHIVMVMDCCNSTGNTRIKEEGSLARYTANAIDEEKNGIASYVFYQQDPEARAVLSTQPSSFQIAEGRHTALYACHSYQLAKETSFKEGRFGVFTYFLLQSLRATKGQITYRDLIKLVRGKASQTVSHQSPQWHSTISEDANLVFMGGNSPDESKAYTLLPTENAKQANLDAGSLHGLLGPEVGKTYFSVFPSGHELWQLSPGDIRQAVLESVESDHSILTFSDGGDFPADTTLCKAIIQASPLAKTRVCIDVEIEEILQEATTINDTGLRDRILAAKEKMTEALTNHPFLELVDKAEGGWQYRLFIYVFQGLEKLRIAEKDNVNALIAPRMGWAPTMIQAMVDEMAHIARWERTLNLSNPQNTLIRPGEVSLEVIDKDGEVIQNHGGRIVLKAAGENEEVPKLKFKAVLHNPHQRPLYCAILHIRPDFGINPDFLPSDAHLGRLEFVDGSSRIKREQMEIYAGSHVVINGEVNPTGLYLDFNLPENAEALNITEIEDHFKLIVSTEQFDPLHLWQNSLAKADAPRAGREPEIQSALDNLLHEVQHRDASWSTSSAEPVKKLNDWWATTVTIKTIAEPAAAE